MNRAAVVAVLLVVLLGLGACSAEDTSDSREESSPSATTTRTSPAPPATPPPSPPRAPRADACYRLTVDDLTRPTNDSEPVPCRRSHTAQTIFVGRLDLMVDGRAIAVDSKRAQRQVSTACPRRFTSYVGGGAVDRNLTRLRVVWFSPTLEDADQGARWFRCDVVAFGRGDDLLRQRSRILRGVLAEPASRDRYALCGTAAPGKPGHQRVVCSLDHSWRALTSIPLEGGPRYPGPTAVREGGDSDCADAVREAQDFALTFTYGWEWPTRQQWNAGQRFGICWMPTT